jgi:hypothetical protein
VPRSSLRGSGNLQCSSCSSPLSEDVQGGLGKRRTREDWERELIKAGFTREHLEHCKLLHEVSEAIGLDTVKKAILDGKDRAERRISCRDFIALFSPPDTTTTKAIAEGTTDEQRRAGSGHEGGHNSQIASILSHNRSDKT